MPDSDIDDGYIEAGRPRAGQPGHDDDGRLYDDAERLFMEGSPPPRGSHAIDIHGTMQIAAELYGVVPAGDYELADAGPRKLPEETPVVRRVRHHADGHFVADGPCTERRVGVEQIAHRRWHARRACPYGWQVRVLSTPPYNRRRLWSQDCEELSEPEY